MNFKELHEGAEPKMPGAPKGISIMTPQQFVAKSAAGEEPQPEEGVAEATGDKPFDQMMTTIKQGTNKQKTADRKEQQKQTQQQARNAFGNMFGGGNPADKLKIREQGVAEAEKKGLYYYVNKRKKAGTSRDADSPKAPTAQAWKDAAKTAKKEDVSEDLDQEFDMIESIIEQIADQHAIDVDLVWEDLSTLTDDELYVFAVTSEIVNEDWQKANKRDKTDGMSQKAVNAYRRENPGSKLKTAVTTKPGKLKKGGKASKRRKSYCSRSRGQMKMHSISCAKTPDKAICKARRRWNC